MLTVSFHKELCFLVLFYEKIYNSKRADLCKKTQIEKDWTKRDIAQSREKEYNNRENKRFTRRTCHGNDSDPLRPPQRQRLEPSV